MRVALLNPPGVRTYFRDGYCSTSSKSGYRWHPLDLLVQSGILTGRGHDVAFVDANALGLSGAQTVARVAAFAPDAVLGLAADVSWPEDVRFYRRLIAARAAPRLWLSGDVPRFEPARAFHEIGGLEAILHDFTATGTADLLDGAARGEGLRMRDGTLTPSTERRWSSPPARHDLLHRELYRLPFHGARPFASVLASYGCPFSCTFCNTGELAYRLRDPGEVVAELRVVRALGYRRVYLRDATANGHRGHWLETCRAIAAADLGLEWNVFCTFRPFDAELAGAMAAAGCRVVQFGIETGSEALRAATGKAFDNASAAAAVAWAHEAGIRVCGHFVLGLPGQSEDDVREAARFARALELDWASFNLAAARPGTGLRTHADAHGLGGGDASVDGFIEGLADVPAVRLKRLRRDAILRFYLRPRPLGAITADLRRRDGWRHLWQTARAVSRAL